MTGRDTAPRDEGVTLIEMLVAMSIMTVVMASVTSGMMLVYRNLAATESLSVAQTQLELAFQRLDKELRYASWISDPGQVGGSTGSWYVEFAGSSDASSTSVPCEQLRLDNRGVLQLLRWTAGSPPTSGQAGQTLASNIIANDLDPDPAVARKPFVRQVAGSRPYATTTPDPTAVGTSYSPDFYRLRLRLTTKVGNRVTRSDITFTAMNTSRTTGTVNPCSEGRP